MLLRYISFALAVAALVLNVVTWLLIWRTRRAMRATRRMRETTETLATDVLARLHDVRRSALEEAAAAVATLAERPYDNEPEFSAVLHAERVIHALIRDTTR